MDGGSMDSGDFRRAEVVHGEEERGRSWCGGESMQKKEEGWSPSSSQGLVASSSQGLVASSSQGQVSIFVAGAGRIFVVEAGLHLRCKGWSHLHPRLQILNCRRR
ncbi:unnamed protein product [Cuscuta europaea]|uniref:Uncharacterized protein n=1 Tax=Cuscuta europaea TaxID=41803 RepID=A0A9P0ZAD0_CUSEU|nr:unnamed protein product [Cuscuta europaea]